jgi:hypothetical protein
VKEGFDMKPLKHVLAAVLTICIAAFLILSPSLIYESLLRDRYMEWLKVEPEPFTGIITLWHIVGFKPYEGSAGSWLIGWTKKFERKYNGVFIEVLSMTPEEAELRLTRGEKPDLYSFPLGWSYPDRFEKLDSSGHSFAGNLGDCGTAEGDCYAIPFMISGYMLLVNTEFAQERSLSLPKKSEKIDAEWLNEAQNTLSFQKGRKKAQIAGLAATQEMAAYLGIGRETAAPETFKSKDAAMVIADLRFAGDMSRALEEGKGFLFEAYPLTHYTDLVQLMGVARDTDEEKAVYAAKFIDLILEEKTQASLLKEGAFPVIGLSEKPEDIPGLSLMAAPYLEDPDVPNAFLYQRYKDELKESAIRALKGDVSGRKDFDERMKELVQPFPIG